MKEIFCNEQVVQDFDQFAGELRLQEEATKQSITIGGVPNNAILLKLDIDRRNYKVRSAYLRRGLEFIHKGCDYCLILPDRNLAILFELKSNNPKGYADQFIASELFIEYCVKLWNKLNCINLTFEFKRILLSPKYNYNYTRNSELHTLNKTDRCNNEVRVYSPGFPLRMRLEKVL